MSRYYQSPGLSLYAGHVLEELQGLQSGSVHCAITSPPYWSLRDYNLPPSDWPAVEFIPQAGLPPVQVEAWQGCLGLEPDPWSFVGHLVLVFRELRRVLRDDGTLWVNLGDSYSTGTAAGRPDYSPNGVVGANRPEAQNSVGRNGNPFGLAAKQLCGIPWRVALALQADGWYLRFEIPWVKRNSMPGSQQDRPTPAIENVFLLAKSPRYYYDQEAVKMPASVGYNGSTFTNGKTFIARNALSPVGQRERDESSGRIRRDSDWFFESLDYILETKWQGLLSNEAGDPLALLVNLKGYSEAHFATFPPDLVEPMIKAGCPAQACAGCGAPWERFYVVDTQHYRPTCDCDAPTAPGVVLDPFNGAGTTGLVANRLGRHYVGIDLNPDYLDMSVTRIESDEQASLNTGRPVAVSDEAKQMTLF